MNIILWKFKAKLKMPKTDLSFEKKQHELILIELLLFPFPLEVYVRCDHIEIRYVN